MSNIIEPTQELLAGRRALEDLNGVELLKDCVWNKDVSQWVLYCRLTIKGEVGNFLSNATLWYVLISPLYPRGAIDFYPAKEGGISRTFQHQRYNAVGVPDRPWRTGNICLQTGLRGFGRQGL